jgi:hypothetical protein
MNLIAAITALTAGAVLAAFHFAQGKRSFFFFGKESFQCQRFGKVAMQLPASALRIG